MSSIIKSGKFYNDQHPNQYRDWVVGEFVKDPSFNSNKFEFKWQRGEKGHYREPKDVIKRNTKTLAVLAYGKVRLKFIESDVEHYLCDEGDYILWSPDEPHEFEFLKDTLVLTLRWL